MNIVIVGQGAMGLLWYHHIQQLTFNSDKHSAIQLHLLPSKAFSASKLTQQHPQYTFTDHNNYKQQHRINYAHAQHIQEADLIILCLKSFNIASALKEIAAQLHSKAMIVLAHNGLGTLAELTQSITKRHNIYALLTTHGCLRTAPLTVTHTGLGTSDIGLVSGISNLKQQQSCTQLLNTALASVTYHQSIQKKQWLKLAVNCVINPLTAINNIDNGLVNSAEYQVTIVSLLKEIIAVASAEKVELTLTELEELVKNVAKATAKNSSSMRCDVIAKRRSEIDYINGYIHRLGIKHEIATPENTQMWQQVQKLGSRV